MGITAKGVKNYRTRVKIEQAILVTHDNLEDAANWCGGRAVKNETPTYPNDVYEYVEFPTLSGSVQVDLGWYLVRGGDGRFRKVIAETYENEMEEFVSRGDGLSRSLQI